ncbi:acyl-CoA dehydrogenase family protein [Halobellus limi]|uniref:Acyl-CoA dehydrogenase n=1 Tax=Halobellus limi TaxID=699433 RepID=A0A1H6AZV8_9EURY|nr:acyl-CoA dehydrogenase [Halobellus limi]QCC47834.1 acyl-CoA dehydrogenase [Halobellus limi]SEG53924.1 Acyl-CoA dehydrogenase [Halobellus limi]
MQSDILSHTVVPEEARVAKDRARSFAAEQMAPVAAEYFDSGEYPVDVVEAAHDAGLVAQEIDAEYGGPGRSLDEIVAAVEEFFRADAGLGLGIVSQSFGTEILQEFGTEEQREEYLRAVAEGEKRTGMAISEPDTGSDLAGMETSARLDGDEWVLNGEKYWIGNGVSGDYITVYAKTEDTDDRHGNHSLLLVPTDAPGYEAETIPEKMAYRASEQAHIVFDDCRVPEGNLVGERGNGFKMVAEFFNTGRVRVAAHGIGLAAAAIEEAWEFVHDREEFGRQVADFQSVQHDLAEMRMEFESARALLWQAVDHVMEGEDAERWAAMAKAKATEVAAECAETAMKLHGGRALLDDERVTRVYRDVRMPMAYEGVGAVQRDLIYRNF